MVRYMLPMVVLLAITITASENVKMNIRPTTLRNTAQIGVRLQYLVGSCEGKEVVCEKPAHVLLCFVRKRNLFFIGAQVGVREKTQKKKVRNPVAVARVPDSDNFRQNFAPQISPTALLSLVTYS